MIPIGSKFGGVSGNAIVPLDAPIQPPQAFVDAMSGFCNGAAGFDASNLGIAHLSSNAVSTFTQYWVILDAWYNTFVSQQNPPALNLSGNALDQATVDLVLDHLNVFVAYSTAGGGPAVPVTVDLSGGTNADPTDGADNSNLIALVSAGATVIVNIAGVPTTFAP